MSPLLFALVVCVSAAIGTVGSHLLVRFETPVYVGLDLPGGHRGFSRRRRDLRHLAGDTGGYRLGIVS